ncbi:hypothetical protein Pint_29407 [Pistacia integerrima]|uniref:Uncharacterized protein n=1 Tax=Pistacia integerrima TaxID=434235 RepID=A0ACC0X2K3_9ROSI|nr:hypothetical protein Pint_29407 [Pistacia integerrima]
MRKCAAITKSSSGAFEKGSNNESPNTNKALCGASPGLNRAWQLIGLRKIDSNKSTPQQRKLRPAIVDSDAEQCPPALLIYRVVDRAIVQLVFEIIEALINGVHIFGGGAVHKAIAFKLWEQTCDGVNFASAGSGVFDTANSGVINLPKQLANFKKVVRALDKDVLIRSVFLISMGGNDYFNFNTINPNATQ